LTYNDFPRLYQTRLLLPRAPRCARDVDRCRGGPGRRHAGAGGGRDGGAGGARGHARGWVVDGVVDGVAVAGWQREWAHWTRRGSAVILIGDKLAVRSF
jgi:hypothetical protein